MFAENADLDGFESLGKAMFAEWKKRLEAAGRPAPTEAHGVHVKLLDLSEGEGAAAGYVTTSGSFHGAAELADSSGKQARRGNRTTWQLLQDARDGDWRAARLWHEWEQTSKGRCAWDNRSKRLRTLANEYVEPVAPEVPEPRVVVRITDGEWRLICRERDIAILINEAETAYSRGLGEYDGDNDAALEEARWATVGLLCRWGGLACATSVWCGGAT